MSRLSTRLLVGRLLPATLLGAVALACGTASNGAADDAGGTAVCPISPGCPDGGARFSYQSDIVPILDQACIPCHSPTGPAGYDESTYSNVYPQRSPMLDQVAGCLMPPQNGPVMTAAQRVAMTQWLQCGAPDD